MQDTGDREKKILQLFSESHSWEDTYKIIINLGKSLSNLKESDKTSERIVQGCTAKIWLKVERDPKGLLIFTGDGDREALISRGLLALMLEFYSHSRPEEILKRKPLFLEKLKLDKHLSPSRVNGLKSLIQQIYQYAQAHVILDSQDKTGF